MCSWARAASLGVAFALQLLVACASAKKPETPHPSSKEARADAASREASPPPPGKTGAAEAGRRPEGEPPAEARELASRYGSHEALSTQRGQATYYGDKFTGRRTASGERYDPRRFTAAHRTLPFGTVVRVVRKDGSRSVIVRITDRGPFGSRKRIIDLSRAAAEELRMLRAGVVEVRVEVVEYGQSKKSKRTKPIKQAKRGRPAKNS